MTSGISLAPLTQEERRWRRLTGLVLLSPLFLLAAWLFAHSLSQDTLIVDRREWLIFWAVAVIGVFAWQWRTGKPANPGPTNALLVVVFSSTLAFAIWYSDAALQDHWEATPSPPERAYEIYHPCGRNCGYFLHQRPDGTTLENIVVGPAIPYGSTCTLVQLLHGDRGFWWTRVLERSPPPEHEIAWPIRSEDCFSNKPLASLKG